jgi:hypothetical protein
MVARAFAHRLTRTMRIGVGASPGTAAATTIAATALRVRGSSCPSLPYGVRRTAKTRTHAALDRCRRRKTLILQEAAMGSIPITRSTLRLRQAMHGNDFLSKILIA